MAIVNTSKIRGTTISATTTLSSFEEVATSFVPGTPNKITQWDTKSLHSLFGLENWENTQLYGILKELNFEDLEGCYLAGGSLVRHLMKTEITKGDIDLYFTTKANAELAVKYYRDEGHKLTKHKFSYQFEKKIGMRTIKVQIIAENTGAIREVLGKFDFEHVRVALTKDGFISTMGATTAIAQKKLHLRYVREPNYSLLRALKYKKLGYDADHAINTLAVMINKDVSDVNAADWENANPIVEY